MKTIWKFSLALMSTQTVDMPDGAEILAVQLQGKEPQLWALCNPAEAKTPRTIAIVGTGHDIPKGLGRYISTFQMGGGAFVWHAFEMERQ